MTVRNKNFLLAAFALVALDQITKIAVKGFSIFGWHHQGMMLGESVPILGDAVRLTFVENPGMAFGISFGAGKIFLSLFSIAASAALAWYVGRTEINHTGVKIGLALILAGATGNLIDRVFYGVLYGENPLFYGYVVDFFDVDMPDFTLLGKEYSRFWVFNVADSCVTVGMGFLLLFNHHLPFVHRSEEAVGEAATRAPEASLRGEETPRALE